MRKFKSKAIFLLLMLFFASKQTYAMAYGPLNQNLLKPNFLMQRTVNIELYLSLATTLAGLLSNIISGISSHNQVQTQTQAQAQVQQNQTDLSNQAQTQAQLSQTGLVQAAQTGLQLSPIISEVSSVISAANQIYHQVINNISGNGANIEQPVKTSHGHTHKKGPKISICHK